MEILLRLVDTTGRLEQPDAVVVRVEPSHTADDVAGALAGFAAPVIPAACAFVRHDTGLVLQGSRPLSETGLVSGETIRIVDLATLDAGGPRSRSVPALVYTPGADRSLVVCSGPDVGRRRRIDVRRLRIGRDRRCELRLSDPTLARVHVAVDERGPDRLVVRAATAARGRTRVNGVPVRGRARLGPGDLLRVGATTLAVRPVAPPLRTVPRTVGEVPFHRTPYYPKPVEPREFDPLGDVPERPEPPRFALLAALAPLVMGLTLAVVYSPRMLIFAVFSPFVAAAGYVESRRRNSRRYGEAEQRYHRKLRTRRQELADALDDERRRRFACAPDLDELATRVRQGTTDLWVRDRNAPDVLDLRVGLGSVEPAVTVRPETRGDEALRDELEAEMSELITMPDVPVGLSLDDLAVVALVGAPADTTALAASLVVQAACLHSPEDLVVVAATGPDRGMQSWLKWLPHCRSTSSPLAKGHLADTAASADDLLRHLLAIAEHRSSSADRTIDPRWPRLLLVLDSSLEPDPTAVSRLLDLGSDAGLSVVWLACGADRVPRQAQATVNCAPLLSGEESTLAYTDPGVDDQAVEIDRLSGPAASEVARRMARYRDASSATATSALPSTVTLHQGFGVDTVTADWVAQQWSTDRGYSVPTPIGMGTDGPLLLDLVEHGPHGLIGGTSGAGKSELLMSIVAGLIALNPPSRVNLLFVDYKGGASSELFRSAPHTVGYVTNLDALLARRALISLRAELNRRMALLQGQAKDLAEMIERHPDDAPPSLVIVVDEFATLVKEVPEFMDGIVDIAQRGRSLGIHLLLATQRPSGAVNDNVLANTNLRISLRMLDSSESTSVIGTNDAALIPPPLKGRAFARLGPGRLLAFQSSWAGAPLEPGDGPAPVTVEPFTPTTPRSPGGGAPAQPANQGSSVKSGAAQVDGLLRAVAEAAAFLDERPGPSPWRDELPNRLELAAITDDHTDPTADDPAHWLLPIGLVDRPEAQDQRPAVVDLDAGGGLAVFGAGGSGKTTLLQTLAAAAACRDSADGGGGLTIFGLDFASRRLAGVAALPQCAAVATGDELEAVTRIVALLDDLLQRRRKAVAASARDGDPPPRFGRVLLLIDDYGNLAQTFEGAGATAGLYPWLETVNRLIVDGRQVGVHCALTANRRAGVRANLLSAITNRIVLRQADPGGYTELGLPSSITADAELPPGRGFLNGAVVQIATVGAGEDGSAAPGDALTALAATITGSVDKELATEPLPDELGLLEYGGPPRVLAIGRSDMDLAPAVADLTHHDLVVLGEPRSGRSTALATIGHQLISGGSAVWAFAPDGSPLSDLREAARLSVGRPTELKRALDELAGTVEEDRRGDGPGSDVVMLVDDVDLLDDASLEAPMSRILAGGVRFVASTVGLRGYSTSALVQAMKKARSFLCLQPASARDVQEITGAPVRLRPGLGMPPGRGVLVINRKPTVIQVSNYFARDHPQSDKARG